MNVTVHFNEKDSRKGASMKRGTAIEKRNIKNEIFSIIVKQSFTNEIYIALEFGVYCRAVR